MQRPKNLIYWWGKDAEVRLLLLGIPDAVVLCNTYLQVITRTYVQVFDLLTRLCTDDVMDSSAVYTK